MGCGIYLPSGYINVDKYLEEEPLRKKIGEYKEALIERGAKYVKADILHMPFPDSYADWVEMHQTIEHFQMKEIIPALTEIRRVMKKGATLIISTNDMNGIAIDWLKMETQQVFDVHNYMFIAQELYGIQVHEGEFHRSPFTPKFLQYVLSQVGFTKIAISIFPKFTVPPKIGIIGKLPCPHGLRNDVLFAEVVKT